MKLSENFTLSEFTASDTARRKGIDNSPGIEALKAIENLVVNLLQPLRRAYGRPMVVNSGFRSSELNREVGGTPTSQHMKGEAADIACETPEYLVTCLIKSGLVFDQCGIYSSFVHLSLKKEGKNRNQFFKGKY